MVVVMGMILGVSMIGRMRIAVIMAVIMVVMIVRVRGVIVGHGAV
jgi:hypothetical protein